MVKHVPLPYVIAGDYGPSPPWLDSRSLIKQEENRDARLEEKTYKNLRRRSIDVFSPVFTEDQVDIPPALVLANSFRLAQG